MSTNIDIRILGQYVAKVASVQKQNREEKKNKEQERQQQEKSKNKAASQDKSLREDEGSSDSAPKKINVWENLETRPYYHPRRNEDPIGAVWSLVTSNESIERTYVASAVANEWRLLAERPKITYSSGPPNARQFMVDNFAEIISGNQFGATANSRWLVPSPGFDTDWDRTTPVQATYALANGGYVNVWVLSNANAFSGAPENGLYTFPLGSSFAAAVKTSSAGVSRRIKYRYGIWSMSPSDYVNGRQQFRHMIKEYDVFSENTPYSESSYAARVAKFSTSLIVPGTEKIFNFLYTERGLGTFAEEKTDIIPNWVGNTLHFWVWPFAGNYIGTSEIGICDPSLWGQLLCILVEDDVPNKPFPRYPDSEFPGNIWITTVNGVSRLGQPTDNPEQLRKLIAQAGNPGGLPLITEIKRLGGAKPREQRPSEEYDWRISGEIYGISSVQLGWATPYIYAREGFGEAEPPSWVYEPNKTIGAFSVPMPTVPEGTSFDTQLAQATVLMNQRFCYFDKVIKTFDENNQVQEQRKIGDDVVEVGGDPSKIQPLVLDPSQTSIGLTFVTDWGRPSYCARMGAILGLSPQ